MENLEYRHLVADLPKKKIIQTAQGLINLYDRMARMTRLGPTFIGELVYIDLPASQTFLTHKSIDVTWGAGLLNIALNYYSTKFIYEYTHPSGRQ